MKVVALAISLGMFYWEPGQNTTGTVCLVGNIAIAVINVFWIMFDVKDTLLFGMAWGLSWTLFVVLQIPLLYVKFPGYYLAVALSSRSVALYVKKNM
jgi:hypothetical protein